MLKEFNDGERVVFLGDSITHLDMTICYIYKYYIKHLKEKKVRFYNAGIAGASISTGLKFYDDDFKKFKPTTVVMMYGMNDSNRFALAWDDEKLKEKQLAKAYKDFKNNLDIIYKKFKSENLRVILCTPTPYCEFTKGGEKPYIGGQKLIEKYAKYVRKFSKTNNIELIDYNKYMTRIVKKHEDAIKLDHTHPTDRIGLYYMAKYFLSCFGHKLGSNHLSKPLENLHCSVYDYRDVVASEFLFIPENLTQEERINYCKSFKDVGEKNEYYNYFCDLSEKYVKNACKRERIFNNIETMIDKLYK